MDMRRNTQQDNRGSIIMALLSLYFIWGSTYLAIRVALEGFPPFMMAGIRFLLTGFGLFLALRARGVENPGHREWLSASVVGGLLLLGGNGGVVYAEQTVSSGMAALSVAAVPLWTVLFAGVWRKWPNRLEWAGIITGFAGVALLNSDGELMASHQGAIALIIAAISWAFGSAWSYRLPMPQGLMSGAVQMISGGAFLIIAGFFANETLDTMPSLRAVLAVLYLMIFGSLIAFSAYIYLLKNVRPALATSYAYVNPVVAVFLGISLAGEKLTMNGTIAMVVIIAGVIMVALGQKEKH